MALKLGPIADDKPVKVSLDIPADIYRELGAYAEAHAVATGQPSHGPAKLIVPMLSQFMASDKGFAEFKRRLPRAAG